MKLEYKPELDGLRSIAIISVLLFHTQLSFFSGGYIGVDIFFVLSGYLITSIILIDTCNGTFSIKQFFYRRIRRILPAFFVMVILTTFIYSSFANPLLYERIGTTLMSISTFISNMYFIVAAGDYFNTKSNINPFLHTWTLGVEEQFYIFLPVFILFFHKFLKKYLFHGLIILFILSFLYSIYLVNIKANGLFFPSNIIFPNLYIENLNAGFYFVFSRVWEFLAGSIIAYIHIYKNINLNLGVKWNGIISYIGLVFIIFSIFFLSKGDSFPGIFAILPVFGSSLIIISCHNYKTDIGKILSKKIFNFIAKISYSMYLWHWPIFVSVFYFYGENLSAFTILLMLIVSFFVSYLSYLYIEKPFLNKNNGFICNNTIFILITFITVLFLSGYLIKDNKGYADRFSSHSKEYFTHTIKNPLREECFKLSEEELNNREYCILGNKDIETSFIVIGDSHGDSVFNVLDKLSSDYDVSGIFLGSSSCMPLKGTYRELELDVICKKTKELAYKLIEEKNINNILFISYWGNNILFTTDNMYLNNSEKKLKSIQLDSLKKPLEKLISNGKDIWVLNQIPDLKLSPEYYSRKLYFNDIIGFDFFNINFEKYPKTYKEFSTEQESLYTLFGSIKGLNTLNGTDLLCDKGGSCKLFDDYGNIMYRNDDHLNNYGSLYIEQSFYPFFEDIKKDSF